MLEPPYYINYSEIRLMIHSMVTSKYFDLAISAVIGLNVITMAMEFYMMPKVLYESRPYWADLIVSRHI
jgi:voltage-dependent calcium channel T type alpha-1G